PNLKNVAIKKMLPVHLTRTSSVGHDNGLFTIESRAAGAMLNALSIQCSMPRACASSKFKRGETPIMHDGLPGILNLQVQHLTALTSIARRRSQASQGLHGEFVAVAFVDRKPPRVVAFAGLRT